MEIQVVVTTADGALATASALVGGPVRHVCPTCGSSEHGRPVADSGLHLSLARDGGHGVVAIGPVPVGVDVQVAGSVTPEALAAADLPPAGDPTAAWVAAEAVGKLSGQGLLGRRPDAVVTSVEVPGLVVAVATWEPVRVRVATSP